MTARPPADPRIRAFCDALAEAVVRQVLAELGSEEPTEAEPIEQREARSSTHTL